MPDSLDLQELRRVSEDRDMRSVVYRDGPLTEADYDEAIEALQNAKAQISGDKMGCMVCTDSGHTAESCHHNPLILARQWAAATAIYACYHCGFIASSDEQAREHFGVDDTAMASCLSRPKDTGHG